MDENIFLIRDKFKEIIIMIITSRGANVSKIWNGYFNPTQTSNYSKIPFNSHFKLP